MSKVINTGITENDLLASLLESLPEQYNRAVHIIPVDLMEAKGYSYSTAMRTLRQEVAAGRLREVDIILPNGRNGKAFVRP
jgi:hypothetical protein